MKVYFIALLQFFLLFPLQRDRIKMPKEFEKPEKWLEADKRASLGYFQKPNPELQTMDLAKVISIVNSERDLKKLFLARDWCRENYQLCFPILIEKLTDTTYVGLTNFIDLMVPGRNEKSWIYGHGGVVNEDIYIRAGRASYILNQITGEDFAVVRVKTDYNILKQFKKAWNAYVKALKKK
ncbi:hypothetical protein ACFQHR_20580 [Rufibacter roseus]|uniref:Uncharacterized protein n=3 Tax=Rufibacter roseus TaxID=1567108 RepID=A0ABW2DUA5_9BACT